MSATCKTVSEWLCEYTAEFAPVKSPGSLDLTRIAVQWFVTLKADLKPHEIKASTMESYMRGLVARGLAPATANLYFRSLWPLFRWLRAEEVIERNPCTHVTLLDTEVKEVRTYEDDAIRNMLAAVPRWTCRDPLKDVRWKCIILMAATTGMRRAEVLNLTRNDIRLFGGDGWWKGTASVRRKAATSTTWKFTIKNKTERTLPVIPELAELLASLLEPERARTLLRARMPQISDMEVDRHSLCLYPLLGPYCYESMMRLQRAGKLEGAEGDRRRRCPILNFRRTFRTIQVAATGSATHTLHDLRRTFTTKLLYQGLPEHVVMRYTGHLDARSMVPYKGRRKTDDLFVLTTMSKTGSGAGCWLSPTDKEGTSTRSQTPESQDGRIIPLVQGTADKASAAACG